MIRRVASVRESCVSWWLPETPHNITAVCPPETPRNITAVCPPETPCNITAVCPTKPWSNVTLGPRTSVEPREVLVSGRFLDWVKFTNFTKDDLCSFSSLVLLLLSSSVE